MAVAVVASCGNVADRNALHTLADSLMSDLYARGLFNGTVVLGRDGEIVYEGGWGLANVGAGSRFTPDTPVDGASLAKNFTATAIWLLVAEGRMDIDAPVQRYVPEYPHSGTLVRHLIEHSAGLPEWEDVAGLTNAQLVADLRERAVATPWPPGSRFSYCNACYDVAALVVERVTGGTWEALLRERIFAPLEMRSTFLRPARLANWPGIRTHWYELVDGVLIPHDVSDNEAFYGSANLYFSARDLHRWAASQFLNPVLRDATLARASAVPTFAGERSALNLLCWYYSRDRTRFYFNGNLRGFHHEVYWDARQRLTVVWMTNVLQAKPLPAHLTQALIDLLEGRTPKAIAAPVTGGPGDGEELASIAGSYDVVGVGEVTVLVDSGAVSFRIGAGAPHEGFGKSGYYLPDFDAEVRFSDREAGRYQTLTWTSLFRTGVGRRVR
jgi:CubicO group peptidase (beta-lactamase class C family)